MGIANSNHSDPAADGRSPGTDQLGSFLRGLLAGGSVFAPGGLRVTDSATGVVFLPGCCTGLEDRRGWHELLDGSGEVWLGHGPDARAERHGETVRLIVDAEHADSPVIELPIADLPRLLAEVERDLVGFLALAADWAAQYLPDHAAPVTSALARALDLPTPAEPGGRGPQDDEFGAC